MSAVEDIQAAIDKLTALKDSSSRGPWEIEPPGDFFNARFDYVRVMHATDRPADPNYDRYLVRDGSYAIDPGGLDLADAELILTLHRTIDAQLAILREGLFILGAVQGSPLHESAVSHRWPLDVARAINGNPA